MTDDQIDVLGKISAFVNVGAIGKSGDCDAVSLSFSDIAFCERDVSAVKEIPVITVPKTRSVVLEHCSGIGDAHGVFPFVIFVMVCGVNNGGYAGRDEQGLYHFRMSFVERVSVH